MTKQMSWLLGFTLCLSACGTTYTAPRDVDMSTVPTSWKGLAGIQTIDTQVKYSDGRYKSGEAIASYRLKHTRTARVGAPTTFTSGAGITSRNKALEIPEGTPLYAVQLSQSVSTYQGGRLTSSYTQSADKNPIEWCTPHPSKKGALCMFWQDEDTAFYQENERGSPLMPATGYGAGSGVGDKSSLPIIIEDSDVTFNEPLRAAIIIGQNSKKYISINYLVGSVSNERFRGSQVTYRRKEWDDEGRAEFKLWGANILVERDGPADEKSEYVSVTFKSVPRIQTR